MEDLEMLSPDYLKARAEQCRRLASQAYSSEIGEELEKLAREYECDALISIAGSLAAKASTRPAVWF